GDENPKLSVQAKVVAKHEIQIDGLLNEVQWQSEKPATGFTQQEPYVGNPAQVQTIVRLLYDQHNLYIGATLYDPHPEEIEADERERDSSFDRSDAFAVLIDTYHDHQSAFFFETNPLSAMSDALISQEGVQV
ncbi:MAG: hydrolase, partial [Candidatus Aminicenantes bacterium]|nr:hydrolase [Candidatus Aminicenantes bacterium]